MAFCRYCGKKLEDGEVCSCQQGMEADNSSAAEPANTGAATFAQTIKQSEAVEQGKKVAMNVFRQFVDLLKAPASNAAAFIRKADMVSSIVLLVLQGLCSAIFATILVGNLNDLIGVAGSLGRNLKISGVGVFFQIWIYSILLSVALAGLYLGATKILKGQISFKEALGVAAMRSVIVIPVTLVACLLGFMNATLGVVCFYIVGTLVGMSFFTIAHNSISDLAPDKKAYVALAVFVVFVLISLLFAKIVSVSFMPSVLKSGFSIGGFM